MIDILPFFGNLAVSISIGVMIYAMLVSFFAPRTSITPVRYLVMICLALSIQIIIVFPEEVDGTVGLLACFLAVILVFFKGSFFLKFSVVLLIYPIVVSINYVTEDIGFLVWKYAFDENMTEFQQTLLHSITLFLRVPCWYLIYRLTKRWMSYISKILTMRVWLVIDMISLTSFVGLVTVINNTTINRSYTAYPVCLASVLTSLGCLFLCSYIAASIKAEMEMQTLKYQKEYYEELEESQQNVRRLRHDMKNHLNVIHTLLLNNETEEAKNYFGGLSDEFTAAPRTFCKSSTINAVLSAKYQTAQDHNIDCQFKVDIEEQIPIDDISLCSLLANTLDNAIEANQKIANRQLRKLLLKMRCKNGYLSYEISNAKINHVTQKQDRFLSDKENPTAHGIGLSNVKSIVESHKGTIDITYSDTEFKITILISE